MQTSLLNIMQKLINEHLYFTDNYLSGKYKNKYYAKRVLEHILNMENEKNVHVSSEIIIQVNI